MSNGPEVNTSTNSTSTVAPPSFVQQPLVNAANAADRAFNLGDESFNTTAGRNLVGQQIRGDFLLPDSNPFLQETFDRGADAIQQRLDSQFSGAGRNIGASIAPAKADLSQFATSLFGGNFANERAIQQNSLNQVGQFNPIDQLISRINQIAPSAGRTTTGQNFGNTEESPGAFGVIGDVLGSIF